MQPTGRRSSVEDERGRPKQRSEELQCDSCGHQHVNLGLFEYIESPALGLKIREPGKPRPLVESKIKDSKEVRFSRKPRGAIQLAWEKGQVTHIHDKVCDNSWKAKDGKPCDAQFGMTKRSDGTFLITCRKCGQTYESG
jgi:hypothetical protein